MFFFSELQKKRKQLEAEAKAELIYWATGRTKIYPEKDFAKNYNEIRAKSEKKRESTANSGQTILKITASSEREWPNSKQKSTSQQQGRRRRGVERCQGEQTVCRGANEHDRARTNR